MSAPGSSTGQAAKAQRAAMIDAAVRAALGTDQTVRLEMLHLSLTSYARPLDGQNVSKSEMARSLQRLGWRKIGTLNEYGESHAVYARIVDGETAQ